MGALVRGNLRKFIGVGMAALVGIILTTGGNTALAKAKGKKNADAPQVTMGTVKSIDGNTLTVEAKKGSMQQFQLNGDTTYKLRGKKGAADENAVKTDIKEGEHVAVTSKGGTVQTVLIEGAQKKAKKKA